MKDRVILLIRALNYTAAQFADEIGVQKSGISHIVSGRNNPSLDFIQKILLRFPEVNVEWILLGKGPMFKQIENAPKALPDKGLNDTTTQFSVPVDLFSGFPPVQLPENRKENELRLPLVDDDTLISEKEFSVPANADTGIPQTPEQPQKETHVAVQIDSRLVKGKPVIKIIEFYSDNTFREFYPAG